MGILKELYDMCRYTGYSGDWSYYYKRYKALEVQYPRYRRKKSSERHYRHLSLGLSVEGVLSLLGFPETQEEGFYKGGPSSHPWDTRWMYAGGVGEIVVFKNEIVTGFFYGLDDETEVSEGMLKWGKSQVTTLKKLKLGISEVEVVGLVGGPDRIDVGTPDPNDSWDVLWRYWDSAKNAVVAFKNKKVVGIYYDLNGKDFKAVGTFEGFRKGKPLWRSLKLGMSEEKVLVSLGLPDCIDDDVWGGDWDNTWRYSSYGVAFKNKKVVGFYYRDSGDTREEGVLKGF